MKKLALLLVAVSMFMSSPDIVCAAFFDGNELDKVCSSLDKPTELHNLIDAKNFGKCFGYIEGFHDSYMLVNTLNATSSIYCFPEQADLGQIRKVVSLYLKNQPEKLHADASILLMNAFVEAFPCK